MIEIIQFNKNYDESTQHSMLAINLSLQDAQKIVFNSQILTKQNISTLKIIEHLGYVQIDTIAVVERAHHHTLWTRNKDYKPSELDKLLCKRDIFEYWSHAASYLPMSEYRFSLPRKKRFLTGEHSWFKKDTKIMNHVLERIEKEGPLKSKDFKQSKSNTNGWWDWKPAKKALENLFLEGRLEVSRRDGFQKVYDLPQRVVPSHVNTSMPSESEYAQYLIYRTLRHHGLATANEIAYLQKRDIKAKVNEGLLTMIEDKTVVTVKIKGLSEIYYTLAARVDEVQNVAPNVHIFSPFDNLIIQREKLSSIFNFEYQIECYVPTAKRKYGYFCLPIFMGTTPVARIDCKAHRKDKKLCVLSIHYEQNLDVDMNKFHKDLTSKLKSFAKFNSCILEPYKF